MKKATAAGFRPIALPSLERRVLKNGLTVHVGYRGPLPMVAVRYSRRGGAALDAENLFGQADFTARLLRRGAAGRSANEISDALDFVGATMGGFASEDVFGAVLSTPTHQFEPMMELFSQILSSPDFPEAELELTRRRTLAQLQNDLDDPGTLADHALGPAMFGTHPYAHDASGSRAGITALKRSDLVAYHQRHAGPAGGHLFIIGAIDPDAAFKVVDRFFSGWSAPNHAAATVPDWSGVARNGDVIVVNKPEQTQVQVRVAARGLKRGHPDAYPLTVASTALGGSFTSRLVREIRVKRGLSYGAGCHNESLGAAGAFVVSSFTETSRVKTLIDVALAEVAKMKKGGPTPAEMNSVQRYLCGMYPSRLETNEAVLGALCDQVLFSLPEDAVARFREKVMAVSREAAKKAAADHLFDEERVIVCVGNAEQLQAPLAQYGNVSVIEPLELR